MKIDAAAISTPMASFDPTNTGRSAGMSDPASMAMATPMNIAAPPP